MVAFRPIRLRLGIRKGQGEAQSFRVAGRQKVPTGPKTRQAIPNLENSLLTSREGEQRKKKEKALT